MSASLIIAELRRQVDELRVEVEELRARVAAYEADSASKESFTTGTFSGSGHTRSLPMRATLTQVYSDSPIFPNHEQPK